ncbi:MAG: isochorismatase hydrolase [Gemmatimonadetes bacterium]|nr:isochorismatase hydrolase [Gemmatimonadota bacterium]
MQALLVVDAQNEFSSAGLRPVPGHDLALEVIRAHVARAREERRPIAWIRHFNKPAESRAFVPGTWGAELSPGLGPEGSAGPEQLFGKDVYGAFSGTGVEEWLRAHSVTQLLIVGFYAHMCLSTSVREALVRGFDVVVDPRATGARALDDEVLGRQSADEVRRTALLQVVNMGARLVDSGTDTPTSPPTAPVGPHARAGGATPR